MPATFSLSNSLAHNYPSLTFTPGDQPHWAPSLRTVFYNPDVEHADWLLLHETAHALLNHQEYARDIELLKMESAAWHYAATTLAPQFDITISSDFIEAHLDTYRDWLHTKSTCPTCQSNGIERTQQRYTCLHCGEKWRTNIGVETAIRRFITS